MNDAWKLNTVGRSWSAQLTDEFHMFDAKVKIKAFRGRTLQRPSDTERFTYWGARKCDASKTATGAKKEDGDIVRTEDVILRVRGEEWRLNT